MIDVVLNPAGIEDAYLACMNECFADWGNMALFEWCFRRPIADRLPDLLILREGQTLLAGSGVSYRRLQLPDSTRIDIGCMTGSWTLPAARKRGCFSQLIDASLSVARSRGCVLLLAYVTTVNISSRRLIASGAHLLRSAYLTSGLTAESHEAPGTVEEIVAGEPWRDQRWPEDCARYCYEPSEWIGQFVERPGSIRVLRVNQEAFAVIESKNEFDRVLQLSSADRASYLTAMRTLQTASSERGRRLFAYSVTAEIIQALESFGFESTPGYVTALPADPIAASKIASQWPSPAGSWPYGRWWVANGDRM